MSCDGVQALNPLCQTQELVTNSFDSIADQFAQAANSATTWLWSQIDDATRLDLSSPQLLHEMATTAAVAGVVCLGLFVIQVAGASLRHEPGALGRALKGLIISAFGSAAALASTRLLISAVDALCAGFVAATMGTNMQGIGQKLALAQLNSVTNPVVTVLLATIVLCSVVVVWAAMMIRKMTILIAAVLAPLAFAGATADITHSWVRRWIEFTAAMIASKLLLVIIFAIGASALNGAGSTGSGTGQDATQLATGSLILLLGGLAPWVAIRMFHFAGDAVHAAHATATQATAGGATLVSMPQKASRLYFQGRAAIGSPRPPASSPRQGRPPASLFASPNPPTQAPTAGAAAEPSSSVEASPSGAGPLTHSGPSPVRSEPAPRPSTTPREQEALVRPATQQSPKG
jgi:hypothetical protein